MNAPPEKATNRDYAFALHGGAGAVAGRNYTKVESHLRELTETCRDQLAQGESALDVVELAVCELESSGLYVAGRGSAPNSAGYVELDASIMSGFDRAAGAVAALPGYCNPIRIARGVMERTPHVLLAGNGAAAFASTHDYEPVVDPGDYYVLPVGVSEKDLEVSNAHGTVGAVALDTAGRLAAGTSTGGTFGKLEGRVGDTPLVGPGTWADDHIAISFTGTGEHIIRAGGAVAIACAYKSGIALGQAITQVLDEIQRLGGDAGVIAVTSKRQIEMLYNSDGMKRASVSSRESLRVATFAES